MGSPNLDAVTSIGNRGATTWLTYDSNGNVTSAGNGRCWLPRRTGGSRRRPHVSLICQSKSEHIIRDEDIADVDGRTLTE